MTDEEQVEAERLAYQATIGEPSSFQDWFVRGYAAACESNRAENDRVHEIFAKLGARAERTTCTDDFWALIDEVVSEYTAARD